MKKRQITIKDIAKALHISPSTVSRSLADHPDISQETKNIVNAYAREHKYKPNALALSLRTNNTKTIGVILPQIVHYFFSSVLSGIEDEAEKGGYRVIICQSNENYEKEVKGAQALLEARVCGVLASVAKTTTIYNHFQELIDSYIPMVFFDRIAPNLDTDRVLEDDYKGACTVVRHMIDGGCRKIAHIALPRRYLWAQKREKGYLQALKDRHLFTDEKLIVECEDVSEVYRITRQLVLHSGVDGIFAANDAFAVHVLSVLRQMKCRVPEEVAVCGYGNEPSTEVTFPALTTVNKDGYRVGNIAAGLLIRRIEDKEEVPTVTRLLKPELIVRDSTLSVDR